MQVLLDRTTLLHKVMVLETTAFDVVLGMDVMNNPHINGLLLRLARLMVDNEIVSLREESEGRVRFIFRIFNTEYYALKPNLMEYDLSALGLRRADVLVDLFARLGNA